MGYKGLIAGRPPTKTQSEVLSRMAGGWRLRSMDNGPRESFWLDGPQGETVWVNGKTHRGLLLRRLVDIDLSDNAITRWMLTARGREALKKG